LKLLLDTHIWLWAELEPNRLSGTLTRNLQSRANERVLSPVSVWEVCLLHSKGRLRLPAGILPWVRQALRGYTEAPFTHEIAAESVLMTGLHADPADRFLAATAKVLDLTLVTADAKLLQLPGVRTMGNE